jgi:hypothetical protein
LGGFLKAALKHLEPVLTKLEWLTGSFSVADTLMSDVLRRSHPAVIWSELAASVSGNWFSACIAAVDFFALDHDRGQCSDISVGVFSESVGNRSWRKPRWRKPWHHRIVASSSAGRTRHRLH